MSIKVGVDIGFDVVYHMRSPLLEAAPGRSSLPRWRKMADSRKPTTPNQAMSRLSDVARRADVHISTASRALHTTRPTRISKETIDRVRKAAEELGYQPNVIAAGLRRGRSETVGVVVPDLTNPMFPPMYRGIEDRLLPIGYSALLTNSDFNLQREWQILNMLQKRQVEGLILATARIEDPIVEAAIERGIEVVALNRTTESAQISCAIVDDRTGILLACQHLLELGHRRIAHIAGPQNISTGRVRRAAFVEAMLNAGVPVREDLLVVGDAFSEEVGYRVAMQFLKGNEPPTAIVASSDKVAIGAIRALIETGLSCPDDVSVTGYNDMPFADQLGTPLTSVRIPHYRLGVAAAELLLQRIRSPDDSPESRILQPVLVTRKSTAPRSARRSNVKKTTGMAATDRDMPASAK